MADWVQGHGGLSPKKRMKIKKDKIKTLGSSQTHMRLGTEQVLQKSAIATLKNSY
jgi:hypothetical protein